MTAEGSSTARVRRRSETGGKGFCLRAGLVGFAGELGKSGNTNNFPITSVSLESGQVSRKRDYK